VCHMRRRIHVRHMRRRRCVDRCVDRCDVSSISSVSYEEEVYMCVI
jgi:hypothetical protein